MAITTVRCDTIGDLDGGSARLIVDAALREAILDLEDRGHDHKPRKANISVTFTLLDNGQVDCRVEAHAKLPPRKTASTIGDVSQAGEHTHVAFRKHSPDNPQQSTIHDLIEGSQPTEPIQ